MTLNRIKEVALSHFTDNGYEGTSMALIAQDVGIKKQSIYSHFKSKDELFLQVSQDVFADEFKFVCDYIEKYESITLENFLYQFILSYKKRYEVNDSTKFWLRITFFPPNHLYDQIIKNVYKYLDQLEEILLPVLEKASLEGKIDANIGSKRATSAFLGILDSVFVELLYGEPDRVEKRIDASWYLYWRGLSKA